MRTKTFLCAVVTAAVLLFPTPALAGGWATTLLDPLPDGIRSGASYTVGFWILQHGSHVSGIPLSDPGIKLVDEKQQAVTFRGVAMAEGGHYATAIVVPHDGRWIVFGQQAPFQDYQVGVLTVPGGIIVAPTPVPMPMEQDRSWSTVKPPHVVVAATVPPPAIAPKSLVRPASILVVPWASSVGIVIVLLLAITGLALRIRRQSRRFVWRNRIPADRTNS